VNFVGTSFHSATYIIRTNGRDISIYVNMISKAHICMQMSRIVGGRGENSFSWFIIFFLHFMCALCTIIQKVMRQNQLTCIIEWREETEEIMSV
jgi:hypothetical protein